MLRNHKAVLRMKDPEIKKSTILGCCLFGALYVLSAVGLVSVGTFAALEDDISFTLETPLWIGGALFLGGILILGVVLCGKHSYLKSLVLLMVSVSVILLCAASTLLLEMVEKHVLFSSPKAVLVLSSQVQKAERVWYSTYVVYLVYLISSIVGLVSSVVGFLYVYCLLVAPVKRMQWKAYQDQERATFKKMRTPSQSCTDGGEMRCHEPASQLPMTWLYDTQSVDSIPHLRPPLVTQGSQLNKEVVEELQHNTAFMEHQYLTRSSLSPTKQSLGHLQPPTPPIPPAPPVPPVPSSMPLPPNLLAASIPNSEKCLERNKKERSTARSMEHYPIPRKYHGSRGSMEANRRSHSQRRLKRKSTVQHQWCSEGSTFGHGKALVVNLKSGDEAPGSCEDYTVGDQEVVINGGECLQTNIQASAGTDNPPSDLVGYPQPEQSIQLQAVIQHEVAPLSRPIDGAHIMQESANSHQVTRRTSKGYADYHQQPSVILQHQQAPEGSLSHQEPGQNIQSKAGTGNDLSHSLPRQHGVARRPKPIRQSYSAEDTRRYLHHQPQPRQRSFDAVRIPTNIILDHEGTMDTAGNIVSSSQHKQVTKAPLKPHRDHNYNDGTESATFKQPCKWIIGASEPETSPENLRSTKITTDGHTQSTRLDGNIDQIDHLVHHQRQTGTPGNQVTPMHIHQSAHIPNSGHPVKPIHRRQSKISVGGSTHKQHLHRQSHVDAPEHPSITPETGNLQPGTPGAPKISRRVHKNILEAQKKLAISPNSMGKGSKNGSQSCRVDDQTSVASCEKLGESFVNPLADDFQPQCVYQPVLPVQDSGISSTRL